MPTKVHAVPLQLTSARLRSSPTLPHVHVRGCGQERLPDLLSVCLQLFLYASNGIDSKMRTILYGRQLAVSWPAALRLYLRSISNRCGIVSYF
jgi:hypothetical protein